MELNFYQMAVLRKAAAADKETAKLLRNYDGSELSYFVLLDAYDYWAAYFALGKEEADLIREERNTLAHIQGKKLIKEMRRR